LNTPVKVLLVLDRRGWAYETKATQIANKYKGRLLSFEIIGGKEDPKQVAPLFEQCDLYLFLGFQTFNHCHKRYGVDPAKTLVSIASHESWDNLETTPTNQVKPNKETITYLKQFRGVSAVSYRLQLLFRACGLSHVAYTPNAVPIDLFTPNYAQITDGALVCGYAGRDTDQKKGNRSIIEQALKRVNKVTLVQALCDFRLERKTGTRGRTYRHYEQMPEFYKGIDSYLCLSREEGSCRSVLEAMASGCAIVSTDCGAINELVVHNYNGLIIDRTVPALVDAIDFLNRHPDLLLKMKRRCREIVEDFSWDNVVPYWYKWIEGVI